MNPREYRDHLYRSRSHPRNHPELVSMDFYDNRDSFANVYLSIIPFLALEYFCEVSYDVLPSGLVFPTGYLLFWAFYYSFYKPGFLEDKLSSPHKWDLNGIPTVLLGVFIWFVKVSVVELSHFFVRTLLGVRGSTHAGCGPRHSKRGPTQGSAQWHDPKHRPSHAPGAKASTEQSFRQTYARGTQQRASGRAGTAGARPSSSPPPFPPKTQSHLPTDILHALKLLGLTENAQWNEIHRRYRELAKQFHPDLNPEITDVGRRFMMYDAAYRKLFAVKGQYFPEKRSHG